MARMPYGKLLRTHILGSRPQDLHRPDAVEIMQWRTLGFHTETI